MDTSPLVCIVDDDESVRESLPDLLTELGYRASAHVSAEAFLASADLERADCLILDVAMPGMTGPELQRTLSTRGYGIPVIFITAHAGKADRAALLGHGAVACLHKPFAEAALLHALALALPDG